jgi:hypothetical protein
VAGWRSTSSWAHHRLLANALALAAIAARLRLDELGEPADPALREQLDRVLDELGVRDQLDDLEAGERAVLLAFARSYLAQGLDLIDDPARPSSGSHGDPVLLPAQGSGSGIVATLLSDLGLVSPGMRIPGCRNRGGGPRSGVGRLVVGVRILAESGPATVTDDLMTVRSGGSVLEPARAIELLEGAGFADVGEAETTWNPPLRFVVGTRV